MGSRMEPKFTRSDALCRSMSCWSARAMMVVVFVVASANGRSLSLANRIDMFPRKRSHWPPYAEYAGASSLSACPLYDTHLRKVKRIAYPIDFHSTVIPTGSDLVFACPLTDSWAEYTPRSTFGKSAASAHADPERTPGHVIVCLTSSPLASRR